ncbi:MAG TPA: DoxX family protein [Gracilimonas sp.]|uniref:DoxX family protein n=1 Tax=Gracilimonas sp. TaxID=1974203 RepID=UPI002D8224DA|nr:DoxX family protein [Gracilimonas sp.]
MKNRDLALLLLRIGVGLIFVIAGWGKLTGIEGVQQFFGNMGIPLASIMAWVVALVEFVGGLMVLVGYKVQIPGYLLSFIMLVAMFIILGGEDSGFNSIRLELMLLLTSLAIAFLNTGAYSVEAMLEKSPSSDTNTLDMS